MDESKRKSKFNDGRVILDILKIAQNHKLDSNEFLNELIITIHIIEKSINFINENTKV